MATNYTYIGKGTIYLDDGSAGLLEVGPCSKLVLSIDEEKKELADPENAGGGLADSVSRIKTVAASITMHDLNPKNLAMALRGVVNVYAGGAVSGETHTAVKKGALVVCDHHPDPAQTMTVTNTGATVTYVENTDYIRKRAGIVIPTTSTIADASDIKISYTGLPGNAIQALAAAQKAYRLVFDGLNEAKSGRPITADLFKWKPSPTKGLDLIGDDFGNLELEGDVLKDDSKTGAGLSQFFVVNVATA